MMEAIRRKFTDEPTMEELIREAAERIAERKVEFLKSLPGIASTRVRIEEHWAKRQRIIEAMKQRHDEAIAEEKLRSQQGPRRIAPIPMPTKKETR
jgi:biopolymer transport protein ExbB/TolQ